MSERTCSIDGCERRTKTRGWCGTHYERWRLHGTTDDTWTPEPVCSIEGCERPTRARGWCNGHWIRWSRYGDPTAGAPLRGSRHDGASCAVTTCDRIASKRGWCKAHYDRWLRYGDVHDGSDPQRQWKTDDWVPGYSAAHSRTRETKGSASTFTCIDCGLQAAHWSYDHSDPDELVDHDSGLTYSLDPERYDPRCVPCHRKFDGAAATNF